MHRSFTNALPRACRVFIAVIAVLSGAHNSVARAQPAESSVEFARDLLNAPVIITLRNGNTLTGVLAELRGGEVVLDHELLGEIVIPRIAVDRITREPITSPSPSPGADGTIDDAVPTADPDAPNRDTKPDDEDENSNDVAHSSAATDVSWNHRFRLGLNGSVGPTDQIDVRTSLSSDRTTDSEQLSIRLSYEVSEREGSRTRDRFVARARQEWGRQDTTPWSVFAEGEAEIDQIREEDARLRGTLGLTYQFISEDKTELSGRAGLGGSYDIGIEDEQIEPEALLALSFSHKLTDRQTLRLSGELFPLLDDLGEYRANGRGAWEVALTDDNALTLRIGGETRYDSTQLRDPNVIDYFAEIQWAF